MANVSGLKLEAGSIQNAGDIPQSVLDAIREGITNLPPPTKYTKSKTQEFAGQKRKADGQHEADPVRKEKKKEKKKVKKDSLSLSTDEEVVRKKKKKKKKEKDKHKDKSKG